MLITNLSVYNYYLKNREYPLTPGGTLTIPDVIWETDDQIARAIESLDNFNIVSVGNRPLNYPRTREFADEVNIIGGSADFLSKLVFFR